jgi:prepilin-type N-terminal cleavage/methylation domain-containing protein
LNRLFCFEDHFIFAEKPCRNKQAGFNLVELMIVIAIMATLAAIAIPSYSHYINKSRAISAVVLTEPVRTEVTEYGILHNGDFAGVDNASLNLPSISLVNGSKDVTDITIAAQGSNNVNITATLADSLGALTWAGQYQNGNMIWACTYPAGDEISHYAPQGCTAD